MEFAKTLIVRIKISMVALLVPTFSPSTPIVSVNILIQIVCKHLQHDAIPVYQHTSSLVQDFAKFSHQIAKSLILKLVDASIAIMGSMLSTGYAQLSKSSFQTA